MAEKFYSKYKASKIEEILQDSDEQPFVIYYDKVNSVYRFFRDKERMEAWVKAYETNDMTAEIAAYEFTDSFTAPAPYTININSLKDNQYILAGTTGNTIEYSFQTVDGNGGEINESVDAYYTFKTPLGTSSTSNIYNAGQAVKMIVDDFLAIGTNVITILIRGRSTGTTKTVVVTYYMIELSISSSFEFYKSIPQNTNFSVSYTVKGQGDKNIDFYIDGHHELTDSVSSLETEATRVITFNNLDGTWAPGRHTLQIKAWITAGDQSFYSNLLYFEFVITGKSQTLVLIAETFPPNTAIIIGKQPGLTGEQYVTRTLNWAYYSSDPLLARATITWRLFVQTADGETHETTLATRTADVVSAESDKAPEPLSFMPTEVGSYKLQALVPIDGVLTVIDPGPENDYTIVVVKNTSGLLETTTGLLLKLSGLGRSNDEPEDTISSWSWKNSYDPNPIQTTFYNQPWNDNSGWKDDALILNNGATAIVGLQPFSNNYNIDRNLGGVIEIDFETFNVTDNDCTLFEIFDPTPNSNSVRLIIKPSKATLVSSMGTMSISTNFKSDERVKLAFVIYPKVTTNNNPYGENFVFIYSNGVLSAVEKYDNTDIFNSQSFIKLGNAVVRNNSTGVETSVCGEIPENTTVVDCDAGIKIYYLRVYQQYISMYDELNNFIIDSGANLSKLVTKNDIYVPGYRTISVDKLEGSITTVKITGDLDELIGPGADRDKKIYCGLEVVCPSNSEINMSCANARIDKAGQSTLDKPVPSLHVKLDKEGNVCYDRDGKILPKNRWAFRKGNVPEKKFRLQANYMDSSCAHNASFFRLFNEVSPKVTINNKHVLRTPAEEYAYEQYPIEMQRRHGDDPRGLGWKFPYTLHMVPDSIPCVVVWRKTDKDSFNFLGQYVLMEEKKSNFTNCMRSIYDTVDDQGNPDPFQFNITKNTKDPGTRLWDNKDCHQMELLTSVDDMTLFLSSRDWNTRDENGKLVRKNQFELVYPDEDDLLEDDPSGGLLEAEWNYFYTNFLKPVCDSKGFDSGRYPRYYDSINSIVGDQSAFNRLYGTTLNRWHFAAYYCLGLRNCCSDSFARNMELTTYDGQSWLPKWWDVDMQCGLYQTGACNLEPMTTRETIAPGTEDSFAISGRGYVSGMLHSSWLWDGLERCNFTSGSNEEVISFMDDVRAMDKALYDAGWNYQNMNRILDDEYVGTWSQSLYNESGKTKYLDFSNSQATVLIHLQGDRTPHRHWFLKTSYDYFDAVNVCGEYTSKTIDVRTEIPYDLENDVIHNVKLTAGADTFFGWGTSISNDVTGIEVNKGQEITMDITRSLQLNNPLHIFSANKISELDFSDIARFMAADLNLSSTYDSVTGTYLRRVTLGIDKEDMMYRNTFNRYDTLKGIGGMDVMTKVEYFDIGGLNYIYALNFDNMIALKEFKAAGTRLTSFNPAGGSNLRNVELPTTVITMTMNGCSITDSEDSDKCSIKWYKTNYGQESIETSYYEFKGDFWEKLDPNDPDIPSNPPVVTSLTALYELENVAEGTIYKVNLTVTQMNIEPVSVPTTLSALILTGMGGDKGTQDLVVSWIDELSKLAEEEGNDSVFNNVQLTYTGIQGKVLNDFDIKTLLDIAKIPEGQRRLNGYIMCEGSGPSGAFTSEEMNQLIRAYGPNIFTLGSNLCIDCVSGQILVSATGSNTEIGPDGKMRILQGTSATLKASSFPLSDDSIIYEWFIRYMGNNGYQTLSGNSQTPIINYQNVQLNYLTGEFVTIEGPEDNLEFEIGVNKKVNGETKDSAYLPTIVQKRTYPSGVSLVLANGDGNNGVELIDGVYQIKQAGTYIFDADFGEESFTGTLSSTNGGVWVLQGANSSYVTREDANYTPGKNKDTEYRLVVRSIPDNEVGMTLRYTANWKNGSSISASPVSMTLSKIIQVLTNELNTGNQPLYQIFSEAGYAHDPEHSYYTSIDLKRISGEINFKEIADDHNILIATLQSLYSGDDDVPLYKYNIPDYLSNVTILNLNGCSGLNRDVDISNSPNNKYEELYLNGTNVNAIIGDESGLTTLELGTPTEIDINLPKYLRSTDISVENSSNLTSLRLVKLKDNKTFSEASEIIEAGADESLTHLYIEQGTSSLDQEQVNSLVIDNLASVVSQLDNSSDLIGRLYAPYVYEDSYTILKGPGTGFDNLTIDKNSYYIPFRDHVFRNIISQAPRGDGFGILSTDLPNITSLDTILQNSAISDLSDLYQLTYLNFNTTKTSSTATFLGCTSLTSITFPVSTTRIGEYTFVGNNNLINIDFSYCTSLTRIENNAFYNCTGTTSIDLSNCNSLEYANLEGLSNLDEIVVDGNSTINTLKI